MADFLQEKPTSRTKQRPATGRHRQLHGIPAIVVFPAPVAQLDRALASEAKGRAFESHRARQSCRLPLGLGAFFLWQPQQRQRR